MGVRLQNTPALRAVAWRDLRKASVTQTVRGFLLTPPWLVLSLVLAQDGLLALALPVSAVFFMAGLRQAHDGFHRTLGLPRGANDGFLFLLSLLMGVPLHAVKYNHLYITTPTRWLPTTSRARAPGCRAGLRWRQAHYLRFVCSSMHSARRGGRRSGGWSVKPRRSWPSGRSPCGPNATGCVTT